MSDAQAALTQMGAVGDLGGAPVEVALRELLSAPLDGAALDLLHRYQRKLDIGRKLVQRYADDVGAAQSAHEISPEAYVSLAQVFTLLAERESGRDEMSRARILRYVNSAFNCIDRLEGSDAEVVRLLAGLEALV